MVRRELLLGLGATSMASALLGSYSAAQDPQVHSGDGAKHHAMATTAQKIAACSVECSSCYSHCTMSIAEGKKEHAPCAAACLDCADICAMASRVVGRHGAFLSIVRDACVQACLACSIECEKLAADPMMKKCASVCRECAEACKRMHIQP